MRSLTVFLLGLALTLALAAAQTRTSKGLDLYVVDVEGGNAEPFVAPPRGAGGPPNPTPAPNGAAFWIKVSAQQDGSYTVTNTRNSFSKTYKPKNQGVRRRVV